MAHLAISITLALLVLGVSANGLHTQCNGLVVPVQAGTETLYVEYRGLHDGTPGTPSYYDYWIYRETNGRDGLQSGGSPCLVVGSQCGEFLAVALWDPCYHPNPDMLIH